MTIKISKMDKDCETAFRHLISNFTKRNPRAIAIYNVPRFDDTFEKTGLTAKGIADLVYGYSVKDEPELFGVTEEQTVLMRVFVKQNLYNRVLPEEIYSVIEKILN